MPTADVLALRSQVVLEWFQSCEELRDAISQNQAADDIQTAASKVGDHLGRVVSSYREYAVSASPDAC